MATSDIVEPLSEMDRAWLQRAEQHALELLRRHFGNLSFHHDVGDLSLVQRAVDAKVIGPEDELEQQCIGVVLGNVFDAATEMKWVRVTNSYGCLLSLHASRLHFTLYPLAMIVKRYQEGRHLDVPSLYQSFVDDLSLLPS